VAWQKAIDFADRVLVICDGIPARAAAGILPQLRRAVISIPANLAEGYARPLGERLSYLRHARGSLREADTQLELLRRRGVIKAETLAVLLADADEIGRLTFGLMRRWGREAL
jgi:four helix bundle protein